MTISNALTFYIWRGIQLQLQHKKEDANLASNPPPFVCRLFQSHLPLPL